MSSTAIKIPNLPSWEKNTNGYQLFRAGLGYLRITPTSYGATESTTRYMLCLQPDLDGLNIGPSQMVSTADYPEKLVTLAQQLYTTQHDQPVKHNTFQ